LLAVRRLVAVLMAITPPAVAVLAGFCPAQPPLLREQFTQLQLVAAALLLLHLTVQMGLIRL